MRLKEVVRVGYLAEKLNCRLVGDPDLIIKGISTLEDAAEDELTFVANPRYVKLVERSAAGAIIISPHLSSPSRMVRLETNEPYSAFQRAMILFFPPYMIDVDEGVHPSAVVHPSSILGKEVRVGPYAVIEEGAKVGEGSVIYPFAYIGKEVIVGEGCIIGVGAVLRRGIVLGKKVVIGDGAVIGYDGFGYASSEDGFRKIPQVGTVVLEDEVEIGANACIDRGTLGETRIARGTKIDNLVQVAHNVHIGENSAIAAQVGISGSTRIGSRVLIGGQAGLVGHIEIGDNMIIGAQAGVTKSFDIRGMISGYPARPQFQAMKVEAALQQLPQLLKRVKVLEELIKSLQEQHHTPTS